MALLSSSNIGIAGIAACVPKNIIDNYHYTQYFSADVVRKVVDKIGIQERRFTDEQTCASDLCYAAANRLIADMNIKKEDIDALIFISQTPDYRMPATSFLLHERLGLPKTTMAFDLTLGCSAFLYGLSIGYSLLQQPSMQRVLILDGETRSKVYSPKDRKTAFLFGDAGAAILLEKGNKYGESHFSLNSDGSMSDAIKIDGGGYRMPSSVETLRERVVDEYGNIRNMEQGYMNGDDVFNFVAREVPKDIKTLCDITKNDLQSFDFYLLHQANDFMNQFLIRKLKLCQSKVPSSIAKFGNTSSVSIPLTIVSELQNQLYGQKKLLLSAFGVGLSWGTAIINTHDCQISQLVEI
ncbi:MAG: ketoacyl-ACP synthase III [Paludibacteraceae bacterium]|nr:ketoacyl-ACP synthase III [Paludibacteraceae bacterium]